MFVGSFWDQQLKHDVYRKLFERELQMLFDDLQDLPKYAAVRKINDFIKRARLAKIHAYIISSLKQDMPRSAHYDRCNELKYYIIECVI